MFKPNKKTLLLALGLFGAISVAFIVYRVGSGQQNTTTTEKFQQNLNIPNYFQGSELKISNNIKNSDFKFPQKLPYVQQSASSSMGMTQAKKIASDLGITGEPLIISGLTKETSLIWNGEKYSLIISQNTNSIQVGSGVPVRALAENVSSKVLTDEEYSSLAQDFIANKIGLDFSSLHFSGFSYFKIQNGVESFVKGSKGDSDIVQLNYYKGSVAFPILTTNPDEPQIYIQFLKDGTFSSFTANLGSGFQNSPSEYPLKNFDQFSKEIEKSTIVSLNDNNINLPDLKSDSVSNIQANTISLVYLLSSPKDTIIQPVFLIGGTANVKGFDNSVNILMYLPAFQGFSQP